jgi:hypothetical protein
MFLFVKSNALPETARAIVNTRTEIFSTRKAMIFR